MKVLSNMKMSGVWFKCTASGLMFLLSMLIFLPNVGKAEDVSAESENAFVVRLPVFQRSAEVDPAKVQEGLKTIISRFRGSSEQGISALLLHPLNFLRDFHYESAVDPAQGAVLLVLNFEGDAIMRHLRPVKETLVETQGTNLLHWWALEDGSARQLIGKPKTVWSSAATATFTEPLMAAAVQHGVSLQLPSLDPRDARQIQARDVFGFLLEPIQKASLRYPNDGLVIGSIKQQADGQWQGHWMLVVGSGTYWFEGAQPTLEKMLDQAMLKVSQQLASLPKTLAPKSAQWLEITVLDVGDYATQRALETYLGSLFWIEHARLAQLSSQHAVYRLRTHVLANELPRRFSEDHRLQLPDTPLAATAETASPKPSYQTYQWVRP